MKEGMKKRFALLLAAVFALTLVFNVTGANAETPTGSTYNTPTGSTYNTPTNSTYGSKDEGKRTLNGLVKYKNTNGVDCSYQVEVPYTENMTADSLYQEMGLNTAEANVAQTRLGTEFTGFKFITSDKVMDYKDFFAEVMKSKAPSIGFTAEATYGNKFESSLYFRYPSTNRFGYDEQVQASFLLDKDFLLDRDFLETLTSAKEIANYRPEKMSKELEYSWIQSGGELTAKTSNYQVLYDVSDLENFGQETDEGQDIKVQVVSAGTKITLPETIDGKPVKWMESVSFNGFDPKHDLIVDDTYTINSNMYFYAVWDSEELNKVPENVKAKEETNLKKFVADVEAGSYKGNDKSYRIEMQLATVVPHEYLDAIKGHDVDLNLCMYGLYGYTWTINGKSITDSSDIDLEVRAKNAVPSDAVASLAGSKATKQISLAHEGPLGFDATLTWNVGKENQGEFANLYWYKPDGTFEYISNSEIDKYGDAELKFTHASDYVIVLSDKAMGAKDATVANDKIIAKKIAENTATKATKSPKTGEF